MKKIYILFIFSIFALGIHAQDLKIGLKAGANLSDASGKAFKQGFNFGYQIGLFSEMMVTKKYGLQPEVLLSESTLRPGSDFNDLYQGQTILGLTKIKLQYLTIPVLFNYKPISLLALQLGPQFGILMNQTKSLTNTASDAFKNGDLAIVAGAQLTVLKFRLYGRYALGTKNLNVQDLQTWKTQQVQLGIGVTL